MFISILRGLLGIAFILGICLLLSENRKKISWRIVVVTFLTQFLLAVFIVKIPVLAGFFGFISRFFILILDFSKEGSRFVFGSLVDSSKFGYIFAFQVLPSILFFSALTSVLYYFRIIQRIVSAIAWLMKKILPLGGAESIATVGNVFLGQIEASLLAKEYIPTMSRSEIALLMISGLSTIAGGVMAAYISFLGGDSDAERMMFGRHLISASFMAAPGSILVAKMLVPETGILSQHTDIMKGSYASNVLDAIAKGTLQGLKLVANVAAILIVFIAFIYLFNFIAGKIGEWTTLNEVIRNLSKGNYQQFSLQAILGYALSPFMWVIGICADDITLAGILLGEKIITNEFIAYVHMAEMKSMSLFSQDKTMIMLTYILCGFANIGSIGMQIGGIGALVPEKRSLLSALSLKALVGGVLTSLLSATIIGMLL